MEKSENITISVFMCLVRPDLYIFYLQMIVEEMNILTTIFLRVDNQKIMYPNSTLLARPIGNYYRSPDMGDSIDFTVHISTPTEKIAAMKQRIIRYMFVLVIQYNLLSPL